MRQAGAKERETARKGSSASWDWPAYPFFVGRALLAGSEQGPINTRYRVLLPTDRCCRRQGPQVVFQPFSLAFSGFQSTSINEDVSASQFSWELCSLRQAVELPSEEDGEDEEGKKGEGGVAGGIGRNDIYRHDLSRPDNHAQSSKDSAEVWGPEHGHPENDQA